MVRDKRKRFLRSGVALFLAITVLLTSVLDTGTTIAQATAPTSSVTRNAEKAKTKLTVTTQKTLLKALADKDIKTITIKTDKSGIFTVPDLSYKSKILVIQSAKASVVNGGTFKKLDGNGCQSDYGKSKGE